MWWSMGKHDCVGRKTASGEYSGYQKFIWRMCVSFRGLNKVTKIFEYPIPRCDDAITIFQVGSCIIWIITVDARQGYHKVMVRAMDREKLAFFAPDDKSTVLR